MNPASRITAVVDAFSPLPHANAQVSGWYLWLEAAGTAPSEESVILALQAVRRELRTLEQRLKQLNVPESLYQRTVSGLQDAFQTSHLHIQWSSVQAKVTALDVRLCLAWMSWALGKFDEADIDADALAALQLAIAEQEALLQDTQLPDGLRELLAGQVEELRVALMLYRLNGVQPIVDAVNKHSGEMRNASDELVTTVGSAGPVAKEAVNKAMALITGAAKIAESGSKIMKFGKEFHELTASGYALFGQLLLPGPPGV